MDKKMKKDDYWKSMLAENKHNNSEILQVTNNNKMCTAPFNSLYVGQHNLVSHCCGSRYPIGYTNEQTLSEIMDGEKSIDTRRHLLKGEYPNHCESCDHFEQRSGKIHPVRDFFKKYKYHRYNVKTNGEIKKHDIKFLDLLFSNKCNFACMGCSPELSSTIADNYMDAYEIFSHGKFGNGELTKENWESSPDHIIDFVIKHKDTIKKIHLNGGEPWMQVGVHKLLDKMLEHGLHKKIELWTHTNGSIRNYKGVNILEDYLKHWGEKVSVSLSHDMYYEKGEYVRYGLKTKKWENTLQRLLDINANVSISCAYSIFNATNLQDLYNYYRKTLGFNGYLSMGMWIDPKPFSAPMLQSDPILMTKARKELKAIRIIKSQNDDTYCRWDINRLLAFLNTKWSNDEIQAHKKTFPIAIDKFDKLRNTDFLQTFPELKNLYYLN